MDPREVDAIVQRLVANPHDQEALAYAHQAGTSDPRGYATLLERVGRETPDPAYASHWLSEAANVWATTLGDAHHAAEVLLLAVVKDPTQDVAAERLAQLYREKGDIKGLVALLEKRAKLLSPHAAHDNEVRTKLAAMHEELGTLWAEPPLSQPSRALDNFRRAYETDPQSVFAIYSARELLKQMQQYVEASALFAMEQALITDPERKVALYRDEADVCRLAQDLAGVTDALRNMRAYAPDDPGLIQEHATSVLERVRSNAPLSQEDIQEGGALFVALAETYDGEHGYSYSVAALEIDPANDRAVQLATFYGEQLGRQAELPPLWKAYMSANPGGAMAGEISAKLSEVGEPIPQPGSVQLARESAPRQAQPAAPAHSAPVPESQPEPDPDPEPEPDDDYAPLATEQISPERLSAMLDEAGSMANKRRTKEALAKYMEVLHYDPVSPEALAWVDEHLRSKRKFADLRDVYQAASRVSTLAADQRKKYLSNVANICEQQLRDLDGAVQALKQASQIDSSARDNLRRLLEKGQRWDDLAVLLDQEVMDAPDSEAQIGLLKKLAALHEQKRKDNVAAGEAWGRLANLMVGDETPIVQAVKLFEKGERLDLAADVIAENVSGLDSEETRMNLLLRLGEFREGSEDPSGAGDAYVEAAGIGGGEAAWEAAVRCYEKSERWEDAAHAIGEQASLSGDTSKQAALHAREADFLFQSGDSSSAILRLEQAADLEPSNDVYAEALEQRYNDQDRVEDLIEFQLRRALKLEDKQQRIQLRKRAAELQRDRLSDMDGARETLMLVLEDVEDIGALTWLADDARERSEFQDEADLLHRLVDATEDPNEKMQIVLREATVLASDLQDLEAAVGAYQRVLDTHDPRNVEALMAIAELEERRDNPQGAVQALEKLLELASSPEEFIDLGRRLAGLYENALDDPRGAIRALEIVYKNDTDDLEAVARLVDLCERVEEWVRMAELVAVLIEFEGDPEEASSLARRLAALYDERLDRGQEALAVLEPFADGGDTSCRDAYIELGDRLGFKGIVAMKLRDWYASVGGAEQHAAFRGSFERFLEMGRDTDAAQIAVELIRTHGATDDIISSLEEIGVRSRDLDSLAAAHDVMVRELSGPERAAEFVRQAEILVQAGVDVVEASQHGEQGLTSMPPNEVEELLERLAQLVGAPGHVIDLYERQVGRCKSPTDRLNALARAAQVAAAHGAMDRASALFELALGAGVREETIEVLEQAAREGDEAQGTTQLRNALATSLATGTHGARDGGRTRSALLRRAATIAYRDLGDVDRAFAWLGEALVTHVEQEALDALDNLGEQVGDLKRVEASIGKALEQVFDGPLVRQLVAHRAELRRHRLDDLPGAAEDMKRLHDLSPHDKAITDDLHLLLVELRDWRSVVQLLEDQILRGKDSGVRADLARQAAELWEERLADPREAADAWRRVLRMKPGDAEAQAGLERAKSNMLKKPMSQLPPDPGDLDAPPKMAAPKPPRELTPEPPPADTFPPELDGGEFDEPGGGFDEGPASVPEATTEETEAASSPPQEPVFDTVPPDKPQRPDISFRRGAEEELTLSTPAGQQVPEGLPANTDEFPATQMGFEGSPTGEDTVDFVPEDLIESLDEEEDEELLLEPAIEPGGGNVDKL